jgi:hypothetical protein
LIDPVPRVLASKIDKRKKPYNIKNKALPHCRKCGKFQQADRPYETYCSWCDSFDRGAWAAAISWCDSFDS